MVRAPDPGSGADTPAPESGVYPNPSASAEWTDAQGTVWLRRGQRGVALDPRRTRRLLRDPKTLLATWSYGEVCWFLVPEDKADAAARLEAATSDFGEVFPVEWRADDRRPMLMLEQRS